MNPFLRDYTAQQLSENTALLSTSMQHLPPSLSMPIKGLVESIESENYGLAMNFSIDFLEISIQYVSCYLFRLLQAEESSLEVSNRSLRVIVDKIDTKRSLSFGDWLNDMFNPIIKIAQKELPANPLVKSILSELYKKGGNRLLGTKNEPSVVKIRNEYKGHSTTLSNEIYKGVVFTLEPQVLALLRAVRPLYEMEAVDLYPLVFTTEEGYEYVFQSLKDEEITYISSNPNAITLVNDSLNNDFDACLQLTSPSFDIAKEMNWIEMKGLMSQASSHFLDKNYQEKKYNRELFVTREKLDELLQEFAASSLPLFPLLGEAGQGKTNQLCWWTEELLSSNDGVLVFGCSDFLEETLEDVVRRIFGASRRKPVARILDALHEEAEKNDSIVYIFFDAINECLSYKDQDSNVFAPVALYEDLVSLFVNNSAYPRFKVLFTCRNYTWKSMFATQMKRDALFMFGQEKDRDAEVYGFTEGELKTAWSVYQELYQMSGLFEELSAVSRVRLKDPLVLKIACTNHVGRALPQALDRYTSIALFKEMTESIANSYAGKQQYQIMLSIASFILQEYRAGRPSDRIELNTLHEKCGLIYKQGSATVAYTELVNKLERPILRYIETTDGRKCVQFIYERYLEYLMAVVLLQEYAKDESIIPVEVYKDLVQNAQTSVVYSGALRNALIMDYLRTNDYSTIFSLVRDYADDYELTSLVNDVINVFIRENYEKTIFALINRFIDYRVADSDQNIVEYNRLTKLIQANKADSTIIEGHKLMHENLSPILRLGQTATISVVGGMFLSEWFHQGLYQQNPYTLLWKLVSHPLSDIGNETCKYIYYLHNRKYTLEHTPLSTNISVLIVQEMFRTAKEKGLLTTMLNTQRRNNAISLVETGVRLAVILLIDELIATDNGKDTSVPLLMNEIEGILRHFTYDFRIIKLIMPFLQIIMRRQITFQSAYINNAIEYQTFWEVVPKTEDGSGMWCQQYAADLAKYFAEGEKDNYEGFKHAHEKVLAAYKIGDSFSYFVLERLLIVAGINDWENIAPIIRRFFTDEYRVNEWFDYSQMSILYVLYQLHKKSDSYIPELMDIYTQEAVDWTKRCKGYFKGRNSSKANTLGLYKRNVMNWYCDVYCCQTGDNVPHAGDEVAVPAFYQLIHEAVEHNDMAMLLHLLDNISELVSDNGYIHTALALLLYLMQQCETSTDTTLIQAIGKVLATAKNYFPKEVDAFLKRDVVGLKFAGISKYRDEVLSYNPAGERLSDLLTHSFGNFVVWSLVNLEPFKRGASDVIAYSVECSDSFEWYDATVRETLKRLFNVQL